MTIGEKIKAMRKKCGFTQEELADRLSVTPQAISKWEKGNGLPDITQLVPLAQIFGITTDALLGIASASYGTAHTNEALSYEKIIMSQNISEAEKHLAAYQYFRCESDKEPTNYTLMRKCINHAAEISRYADFEDFLRDKAKLRDEIFADCERKNLCISRYCEDKATVESSDFAMAWIFIHTKQFERAKALIDRLPSLENGYMKERIMTQFIRFLHGFEKEKEYIFRNIKSLLDVTAREFIYTIEDFASSSDKDEAIQYGNKYLDVLASYKSFDHIKLNVLMYVHHPPIYVQMPCLQRHL